MSQSSSEYEQNCQFFYVQENSLSEAEVIDENQNSSNEIEVLNNFYVYNNDNYPYLQLKFRDYVSDNESMSAQSTSIHNQDDLLSISFFIQMKTFKEITDNRTDAVLNIERNKESDDIEYHSFQNESDYVFAL